MQPPFDVDLSRKDPGRRTFLPSLFTCWTCALPLALMLLVAACGDEPLEACSGNPSAGYGEGGECTQGFIPVAASTAHKPQSKLWYAEGSWWAALPDERGVRLWEFNGSDWSAAGDPEVLSGTTSQTQCDVVVRQNMLVILTVEPIPRSGPTPQQGLDDQSAGAASVHAFRFENGRYRLLEDFPIHLDLPGRARTMTADIDTAGRIWIGYVQESTGNVLARWLEPTRSAGDGAPRLSEPVVLAGGTDNEDICSVLAFSAQIGVMWSDENADAFFFRTRRDVDDPHDWQAAEMVAQGGGVGDNHINLATESNGRIWAVTKDSVDRFTLRRRNSAGRWDLAVPVLPSGRIGTRPIVVVAEELGTGYVAYTHWPSTVWDRVSRKPHTIRMREFILDTGVMGRETRVLAGERAFNNVTSTKQPADAESGLLIAAGDRTRVGYLWLSLPRP